MLRQGFPIRAVDVAFLAVVVLRVVLFVRLHVGLGVEVFGAELVGAFYFGQLADFLAGAFGEATGGHGW